MLRANEVDWCVEMVEGFMLVQIKNYRSWSTLSPMLSAISAPIHIAGSDVKPCVFEVTEKRSAPFEACSIELPEYSSAQRLTFRRCSIANIDRICNFLHLTNLVMRHCGISVPPQDLWRLTKLEHLDLASNNIVLVPESYSNFTTLRYVDLFNNLLEWIPRQFENCPGVEINLEGNPCNDRS